MRMQHRMSKGLVVGLLAALALAGCGSESKKDSQAGGVKPAEKVTLRSGTSRTSPTPPPSPGWKKGIFAEKLAPT